MTEKGDNPGKLNTEMHGRCMQKMKEKDRELFMRICVRCRRLKIKLRNGRLSNCFFL